MREKQRPPRPKKKQIKSSAAAAALSSPRGDLDLSIASIEEIPEPSPSSSSVIAEMSMSGVPSERSLDPSLLKHGMLSPMGGLGLTGGGSLRRVGVGRSNTEDPNVVGLHVVEREGGTSCGLSILSSSMASIGSRSPPSTTKQEQNEDDDSLRSYRTGGSMSTISGEYGAGVKSLQTARSAISSVGTADETVCRRGDGALIRQGLQGLSGGSSHRLNHILNSNMNLRSARVRSDIHGQEIWKEEEEEGIEGIRMSLPEEGRRPDLEEEEKSCWCCVKKTWYTNRQRQSESTAETE